MARVRLLVVALVAAVVLAGCVSPDEKADSPEAVPTIGWLVDTGADCGPTPAQVRDQAEQLVRTGLRDAGYRTVLVRCRGGEQAKYRTRDDADFLSGLGLTFGFVSDATGVIRADMPRSDPLRTAVTRLVMAAQPLIPSAEPDTVSPENLQILKNREALELLRDARAAPGAPVHDDRSVYSRAIGERGLLVSFTNGTGAARQMSVGVRDLGLAGDDVVPARDVWTGQRITATDGDLTLRVRSTDSALLRIG